MTQIVQFRILQDVEFGEVLTLLWPTRAEDRYGVLRLICNSLVPDPEMPLNSSIPSRRACKDMPAKMYFFPMHCVILRIQACPEGQG